VFLVGYPGYFVFDAIWPSFFYSPVPTGNNAWLLSQGLFIAVYLLGALLTFNGVQRALNSVADATIGKCSKYVGLSTTTAALALVAISALAHAETVEYATLEWVDWFNNRRLLEPIGHVPPAEAEAAYYAALEEPAAPAA
jgi:transposase InsO family protein